MRIADLPLSVKLPGITGVILLAFLLVLILYTVVIREILERQEGLMEGEVLTRQHALEMHINLLQARRAEKDFLWRKDPVLVKQVEQRIREAAVHAETVARLLPATDPSLPGGDPRQALAALERYRESFAALAQGWESRGLDQDSGLQERFRSSARRLERMLPHLSKGPYGRAADATALENLYLRMRRAEKDYLLRQKEEYASQTLEYATTLSERIAAAVLPDSQSRELNQAITTYRESFAALVAADAELDRLTSAMRQAARSVEPMIETLATAATARAAAATGRVRTFGEESALVIVLFGLAVMLAVGVVTALVARNVGRAARALEWYGKGVAAGDLERPPPPNGGDELGQLAGVLVEMAARMRVLGVLTEHMAVIAVLLGRGAVPDRLEGEYPPEFQKISRGLNALIQRLQELRHIAGHLHRINEGEVPPPLEGEYVGEVRAIVESLNGIIAKLEGIGGLPPGPPPAS